MSDNKYRIIQKDYTGIEITGVVIQNKDKQTKLIPMDDAIKLARSDKLSNATAVLDTNSGDYILDIEGGLQSLENTDSSKGVQLELKARLIENNKCIGYKATNNKGKTYRLTIDKVWNLAEQGSIVGVSGRIINGSRVLLSNKDFRLRNLPEMQL